MQRLRALLLLALLAGPAAAQPLTLAEALSGKTLPLTLKLKDLDETWRRLSVGEGGAALNPLAAIYGARAGALMSAGVYYTRGQTVAIGGENYLVAYTAQTKPLDVSKLSALLRSGQPAEPDRPTVQTTLALALLNLRTVGSLTDIRPFNLDYELTGNEAAAATAEEKRLQELSDASAKNLRKLAAAVNTYAGERKVLPLLTDARTAEQELVLYAGAPDVFVQPQTKQPYQPNPALSGRKPADFQNADQVVLFYENAPAADGARCVLFLDGHVDRLIEQQWKRLKEAAHLK